MRRSLIFATLLGVLQSSASAEALHLLLEAEHFADRGGWIVDTQFTHKMGSAYLIAPGVGKPVKDAATTFASPKTATCRVWVRTKDWIPEFHPGAFALAVNGIASKTLGASGKSGWGWEPAGSFDLTKGENEIRLVDRSGAYARCDAVLFTEDATFVPKDERPIVPENVREGASVDVLVVGAGPGGFPAALAAARHGAKTLIVHDRPVLGGNASKEIGVQTNGAGNKFAGWRDTGICEEMNLWALHLGCWPKMSEPFAALLANEPNLSCVTNARVIAAETDPKTGVIVAVVSRDTLTGAYVRHRAKTFVDGTGDGWLGYFAGAKFRRGREAIGEFGEREALEESDDLMMSGTLSGFYRARPTDHPVDYRTPAWADIIPEGYYRDIKSPKPEWWMEHSGLYDELADPERARDRLVRLTFAYWGWVKNGWKDRAKARNWELCEVRTIPGRREGMRLMGDYVFTSNDAVEGRRFPDQVGVGGWAIDTHDPKGVLNPGGTGYWKDHTYCKAPYTVPYRCLYSTNVPNLFLSGRCLSCTHWGLGTLRVEATLATLGQAAGTAAAEALKAGLSPRDYGRRHIRDLQRLLVKDDVYLPDVPNDDPKDLARAAKVTATSFGAKHVRTAADVRIDDAHKPLPLKGPLTVVYRRGDNTRLDAFNACLNSSVADDLEVRLEVRESETIAGADPRAIAKSSAVVKGKSSGYVRFDVGATLTKRFVWVSLLPEKRISWSFCPKDNLFGARAWPNGRGEKLTSGDWHYHAFDHYAYFTEPAQAWTDLERPELVIDGVARSHCEEPHGWMSDGSKKLPQALTLTWQKPVEAREVRLAFDTNLYTSWPERPMPKTLVRSYVVECATGDGPWRVLADETENFLRHRIHGFAAETFDRLRVTMRETWGDPAARLFEVRVY